MINCPLSIINYQLLFVVHLYRDYYEKNLQTTFVSGSYNADFCVFVGLQSHEKRRLLQSRD